MREISFKIQNSYTCQFCQRSFLTSQDYVIEEGFFPVCSSKCGFRLIFNFIKKQEFSDEILLKMSEDLPKNKENSVFNRQNVIFELSKYYLNKGLSNIKFLLGKGQSIVPRDKNLSKGQRDNIFVCIYYTQCPLSCPIIDSENMGQALSHPIKRGLEKWF